MSRLTTEDLARQFQQARRAVRVTYAEAILEMASRHPGSSDEQLRALAQLSPTVRDAEDRLAEASYRIDVINLDTNVAAMRGHVAALGQLVAGAPLQEQDDEGTKR
jgi:hypothetical protein